mgnify:CR=1 FL=1
MAEHGHEPPKERTAQDKELCRICFFPRDEHNVKDAEPGVYYCKTGQYSTKFDPRPQDYSKKREKASKK